MSFHARFMHSRFMLNPNESIEMFYYATIITADAYLAKPTLVRFDLHFMMLPQKSGKNFPF